MTRGGAAHAQQRQAQGSLGTSLRPLPPGESKHEEVRYLDIYEDDQLDEKLVASWIRQASKLRGWIP